MKKNNISFAAISDLHGDLEVSLDKEVDYLIIAGDLVPLNIQQDDRKVEKWLKKDYQEWVDSLPVKKKVLLVAGNHDFYMYNKSLDKIVTALGPRTTYLCNSSTLLLDDDLPNHLVYVYGSPMCKIFGDWAFMYPPEYQREEFDKVRGKSKEALEKEFDGYTVKSLVITHDAPYGCSDIVLQPDVYWGGSSVGNKEIRTLLEDMKPDLNIHGHLHTSNHDAEYIGPTEVRCVSLLDENYVRAFCPYYFAL